MAFECHFCGKEFMIWKNFSYHRMLCLNENGKELRKK